MMTMKKMKKGQVAEILNFLILVVVVTIIIIVLKSVVVDDKLTAQGTGQSAQEEASFRSGVNAFMVMTEDQSGKTFLELLGYVGYLENTTIDLGGPKNPLVINVTEEVAKRLDAIYGKGHWNLTLPIPHRSGIQMFIVIDTSKSMCDDVQDLKEAIPDLMNELKKEDKETTMYIYFLASESVGCYYMKSENDIIRHAEVGCDDLTSADPSRIFCHTMKVGGDCDIKGDTEEDWGNAIACISEQGVTKEAGDKPGWDDFSIRIGIPLSDELPGGSESCPGPTQEESLDNGIKSAKKNKVKIFPLRANPCGIICFDNDEDECCDLSGKTSFPASRKCSWGVGGCVSCNYCECGEDLLPLWMQDIANQTGGAMFDLVDGSPAEAIIDIALNQSFERGPIVLGSQIPEGKRIRSFIIAAPMPNYEYINLTLKQWN